MLSTFSKNKLRDRSSNRYQFNGNGVFFIFAMYQLFIYCLFVILFLTWPAALLIQLDNLSLITNSAAILVEMTQRMKIQCKPNWLKASTARSPCWTDCSARKTTDGHKIRNNATVRRHDQTSKHVQDKVTARADRRAGSTVYCHISR